MSYLVYCTLGILAGYGRIVFSNPTSYDQRQTGDVNVQIHLKDVQVVALLNTELLDDYTDYDYAYDYADFTLKPISKPTTSAPEISSTTAKPWSTRPTNKPSDFTTTTSSDLVVESSKLNITETQESPSSASQQESTTKSIEEISKIKNGNETTVKLRINDKAGNQLFADEDIVKIDEDKRDSTTTSRPNLKKSCPSRYVLDKKGRCRSIKNRRRISLVPLTMRLGSRLSEKGHFTVRKDLPIRVYKSEPKQ